MLFSWKKIQELANLTNEETLDDVILILNTLGFEVDEVKKMPQVGNLRFGKILEVKPNPNGQKLNVCQIQFSDKKRQIQTTSQSVSPNQIVLAFVENGFLDKQKFEPKKLRNLISEGMLVSLDELGFCPKLLEKQFDTQKIATFNQIDDLNLDPIKYLGLNDTILDLKILPQRPDANSYYIISREILAYFNRPLYLWKKNRQAFKTKIQLVNQTNYNFVAFEIKGLPSLSIAEKLLLVKSGIALENNDWTNLGSLVQILTGQPIDFYQKEIVGDYLELTRDANQQLVTKTTNLRLAFGLLPLDEKIKANNQSQNVVAQILQLPSQEMLLSKKILDFKTPILVQRTRDLNWGTLEIALEFLSFKLEKFSNFLGVKQMSKQAFDLPKPLIKQIVGFDFTENHHFVKTVLRLEKLGFDYFEQKLSIARYRQDIQTDQDVIAEVLRIYGLHLVIPKQPLILPQEINSSQILETQVQALGYHQIKTYYLVSEKQNQFNFFDFKEKLTLKTIFSQNHTQIRNSLIASSLPIVDYHLKRHFIAFSFFEIGTINTKTKSLVLINKGKTFIEFKNDLTLLFDHQDLSFEKVSNPLIHPGLSAKIIKNKKIVGWIGQLHPRYFDHHVWFCEILLDLVKPSSKLKFKPYDQQMLLTRDITLIIGKNDNFNQSLLKIQAIDGIESVIVVDQFQKTPDQTKITLRIAGNQKAIQKFDNIFN